MYSIQGNVIGREPWNGPRGGGWNDELCFTLNTIDIHAVAGSDANMGWIVRRITPTECERLQGFPDGWTDIGGKVVKNRKTGEYELKPGETPDTPRYKAIGNSMTVTVMRWIGERMQAADDGTMSSDMYKRR